MTTPTTLITDQQVAEYLGMTAPDKFVPPIVKAVTVYVREVHGDGPYDDAIVHGSCMLAALMHRRRNSPGGVESFGELDPSFVARYDPTISQLLKLGNHRRLVVG